MTKCPDCPMPPGRACNRVLCGFFHSRNPTKVAHVRHLAALSASRGPGGGEAPELASFPPLSEQAGNLAGAVGRFLVGGLARAGPEETARRLAICAGCEQFSDGRCRLCGCRLGLKVAMQTESCPVGNW